MRIKKLLLTSAAFALVAGTASAADLPVYVEPVAPAPVVDIVAYSFTGAWIGVQAGAVFGGELDDLFDDDEDLFDFDDDSDGDDATWEAGIAAGFDWQMGNFVFGVLGDVNWVDDLGRGAGFSGAYGVELEPDALNAVIDGFEGPGAGFLALVPFLNDLDIPYSIVPSPGDDLDETFEIVLDDPEPYDLVSFELDVPAGEVADTFAMSEELNWYATARGRAGVAFGRFMVYGTGGLSYGNVETSWNRTTTYDTAAAGIIFGDLESAITEDALNDAYPDAEAIGDVVEDELLILQDDDLAALEALGCTGTVDGPVTCSGSGSQDDDRWGYALGAGTEVLVTQNFSIGAEYLYVNLGSGDDIDMGELADIGDGDAESEDFDFHTVKVRGAYRF